MAYFGFKHKHVLIFIILISFTTSSTYCSIQKRQGSCNGCINKFCACSFNGGSQCGTILNECNIYCGKITVPTKVPPKVPTKVPPKVPPKTPPKEPPKVPPPAPPPKELPPPIPKAPPPIGVTPTPNIVPIVTTYTESGVETPTPVPENAKLTTIETTLTSYFAGYSTINSLGIPTFVPPSTLYVVKSIAVTEAPTNTIVSDSTTILHDINSHGLWGVTMSLSVITATFIFMMIA
ncbi:hypothetical protein C1646_785138 [Rhizophagus diaphanus]|nr:hypothetical protein C1646_785138 [Rhizophagus diaphanus] [Rhizophagus sp. MUCL 43196]